MLFYMLSALGLVPTFQTTKCKKLLNITMERTKLLEKRRQARVRQLHRDVIKLLQLKKKHKLLRIWKEFCLFFVYAKTAEYCGFVQISLKDIAGQRECPSGLEEPLAGLCFAASCCADLPELQELREIFGVKYGKQIVSSGQDLTPNYHVNQQYLDCLYAKHPSEMQKQALLEEIITKYSAQHQVYKLCDSGSTEGFVDTNASSQVKERIEYAVVVSKVKHQSGCEESQGFDVVQETNLIEMVGRKDLGSRELGKEVNRKRTSEDRTTHCSTFKRAYRRRKFGLNKVMEGEENRAKVPGSGTKVCGGTGENLAGEHHDQYIVMQGEGATDLMSKDLMPSEDLCILHYVAQSSCSQPPQRPPPPPPPPKRAPPPPPPPKRAPPPPPSISLRVISMPRFHCEKQVDANTGLPVAA